jgi:glycosyltransferase involved in cell wall biosynthesis
LINPSHFEGWSTSVEEAKSMGKQIVLSDIPVHREQAPERGLFFPSDDQHALANMMIAAREGFDRDRDAAMQMRAQENLAPRQLEFALNYHRIVRTTLGIDT